ncbi:SEC-C motif protein [Vibrio phage D4]|nr:SEC-C motif protein [Vibrio phage D4]
MKVGILPGTGIGRQVAKLLGEKVTVQETITNGLEHLASHTSKNHNTETVVVPRRRGKRTQAAREHLAKSDEVTHLLKRIRKNQYRNEPCFCGSDKKLKKCCLQLPERELRLNIVIHMLSK